MVLPSAVMAMSMVVPGPATMALDAGPCRVATGTGLPRHMTYTVEVADRAGATARGELDAWTCGPPPPNAPVTTAVPAATAATHAVHTLAVRAMRRRRSSMPLRSSSCARELTGGSPASAVSSSLRSLFSVMPGAPAFLLLFREQTRRLIV